MNSNSLYRLSFGLSEKTREELKYAAFLFVAGSIAGWCLELAFRSITRGYLFIPGFLIGPYCPIYGFGLLIINYGCRHKSPIMAYLKIFVLTSGLEYLISYIAEKSFRLVLWDYSSTLLNIDGRVSLPFSLAWGALGLAFLLFVEPEMRGLFEMYKSRSVKYAGIGVGVIAFDTLVSVAMCL